MINEATLNSRQVRMLLIILVPTLAVLMAVYFLFLRTDYVILTQEARPEEAAAIVADLKKQDVPYELRQQGSTILVPADRADELRLTAVTGKAANAGSVGFELFNQSDMGLTDFAQKVNYQRALQGELARTIMDMDGIAFARVHLALPERSLFRANRSEPRAAVTVQPKPGVVLDAARVAGIQRLVASTITDLRVADVAVLNQRGQLVTADPDQPNAADMDNATAVEKHYADRINSAVAGFDPDLDVSIKVTTIPEQIGDYAPLILNASEREYAVRIVVFSSQPIAPDRQAALARVIAAAVGARRAAGDDILFSLRPRAFPPATDSVQTAGVRADVPKEEWSQSGTSLWMTIALLVGASIAAAAAVLAFSRRRRMIVRERLFVRLRDQLLIEHADAA